MVHCRVVYCVVALCCVVAVWCVACVCWFGLVCLSWLGVLCVLYYVRFCDVVCCVYRCLMHSVTGRFHVVALSVFRFVVWFVLYGCWVCFVWVWFGLVCVGVWCVV